MSRKTPNWVRCRAWLGIGVVALSLASTACADSNPELICPGTSLLATGTFESLADGTRVDVCVSSRCVTGEIGTEGAEKREKYWRLEGELDSIVYVWVGEEPELYDVQVIVNPVPKLREGDVFAVRVTGPDGVVLVEKWMNVAGDPLTCNYGELDLDSPATELERDE